MSTTATREHLLRFLEPVVSAEGLELEDVTVAPAGRRRLLRVIVDRDGGVSLDAVSALSRSVSEALDASEAMSGGHYVLEVTSPGVDRPLTEARHWRRAISRLVTAGLVGGSSVTGRVVQVGGDAVELDVDGVSRRLPFAQIERAKVKVEFNRVGAEDGATEITEET